MHTRALTARASHRARAIIKAAPSAQKAITNTRAFMYAHTSVLTTPRLAGGGRHCSGALLCQEFRVVLLVTRVATFSQARTGEGGYVQPVNNSRYAPGAFGSPLSQTTVSSQTRTGKAGRRRARGLCASPGSQRAL